MVGIHRKIEQREERRERKALVAAKLEHSIQKELVERLAAGTYGDIYNFPEMPYQKALEQASKGGVEEEEEDDETTLASDAESGIEYVEDFDTDDEDDMEDMEYEDGEGEDGKLPANGIELEYEEERETTRTEKVSATEW